MNRPQRVAHVVALVVIGVCALAMPVLAQDCPEVVGHLPGLVSAIAVEGDYAYLGASSNLLVADISDPSAPRVVGEDALAPGVTATAVSGEYAYVGWNEGSSANDRAGLHVIDVSTPSAPAVVGFLDVPGVLTDVAVLGDHAYTVEYSQYHPQGPRSRLRVIDVSDPSAPVEVGSSGWVGDVEALAVVGGYAYVVGNGQLRVIDVSTPSDPEVVGSVSTDGDDVAVSGDYVYVAGGGLHVIDVSTPSAPVEVAFLEGIDGACAVEGGYVYVAGWELHVIDVRTPSTPVEVGREWFGGCNAVSVSGAYLYGAGDAGLRVIGVSTPSAPVEVGSLDTQDANDVVAFAGYAYVAGDAGLAVIDVSSPHAPVEVGSLDLGFGGPYVSFTDVVTSAGHAYVVERACYMWCTFVLHVIDVSTPSAPVEVGSLPYWVSGAFAVSDGYAYGTGLGDLGVVRLRVIDVSTPSAPVEVAFLEGIGGAVAVEGGYLYVAGEDFHVIDVATPSAPVEVGSLDLSRDATRVAVAGGYAYVTVNDRGTGEGGLLVIDVSTPSAPVEVGFVETPEFASEVAVSGEYAYVVCANPWGMGGSAQGLRVIDVSSPSAPVEVGLFDIVDGGGIAISDGHVYFAAGGAGMYTFGECTGPAPSVVPAAAVAAGAQGAFFSTDLEVNNNGPEEAQVSLQWLPRGEDNSEPINSQTFTLAPGASLRFDNVLTELFELGPDSVGALKLNSTEPVIGMSRTYNIPGGRGAGTFGQGLPVIRATDMISGIDPQRIIFLSEDFSSRTNVGCVNGSSEPLRINIAVFDDAGALLETKTMDLAPWSNDQINRIYQGHAPVNGYVEVSAGSINARYFCYGSTLDNLTSDPTTILPQVPSDNTNMTLIPAAAFSAGLEGSFFRTDLDINNVGSSHLGYRLLWLPRGSDNSDPVHSATFSLAPGAGVRHANALGSLFSLEPDQVGALAVEATWGSRSLLAMSRTYNLPLAKIAGTFGQGLPGILADRMIPTGVKKRILFMSESDDVRSNVGCQNGSPEAVRVFLEMFSSEGESLEVKTMYLAPRSNNQITRMFRDHSPISAGYVDVWTTTPRATIFCYGSVLDNVTSDPTTVLPQ